MTTPQQQVPHPRRVLALDPGSRRTGVALSDELGMFAHPRPAIVSASLQQMVDEVVRLVGADDIGEVVVGLPLSLSGSDSSQTETVRALVRTLRESLDVAVSTWDERLSSVQAAHTVRGAAKRKSGDLDSQSAAIVLQAVLDSRRGRDA
ncbi:MAG: Holliday junction resolvase RuvX [Tepidiformaceae bacterium]